MKNTITIGNDTFDYDPSLFDDDYQSKINEKQLAENFVQLAVETALSSFQISSSSSTADSGSRSIMGSLETVFRESYKFIRLADDLHLMKEILNDIRICFIALTISGYVGICIYVFMTCFNRRQEQQEQTKRDKDDELMFRKWSRLERSPTIRQPEIFREDEGEVPTFYCPRPPIGHHTLKRQNTAYGLSLERRETNPLLNDSFTGTNSSMTGSTVRENGGITGAGLGERVPSFPLPAPT